MEVFFYYTDYCYYRPINIRIEVMNNDTVLIPEFDGKDILEGLRFKSAIRVEEKANETTWLVETLSGVKLIIVVDVIQWLSQEPYTEYTTHSGRAVDEYARLHSLSQSNSHHLLTQLV